MELNKCPAKKEVSTEDVVEACLFHYWIEGDSNKLRAVT